MKINLKIDKSIHDIIINVLASEESNETDKLLNYLYNYRQDKIIGYLNKELIFLEKNKIESIFTDGNYVYAYYKGKTYQLKNRLYELEEILKTNSFIRISNSELVNLNKVVKLDLNLAGTIKITLESGRYSYCSRRKIANIKQALKIK